MDIDITTILECFQSGIRYLPVTLTLTAVPFSVGLILGTIFAILYIYKVPFFGRFFQIVTYIFSGVPVLVWMLIFNLLFMLLFDDLMRVIHINISIDSVNTIWIGILALCIDATNYLSQAIKGAFLAIDKGQYEAGYAVGLTKRQTLFDIILPQVIPVAIPSLQNNLIAIFKGTSLVISIGVMDIFNGALIPCQTSYRFLEGYIAVAVIYWTISILMEKVGQFLEKRQQKYRGITV